MGAAGLGPPARAAENRFRDVECEPGVYCELEGPTRPVPDVDVRCPVPESLERVEALRERLLVVEDAGMTPEQMSEVVEDGLGVVGTVVVGDGPQVGEVPAGAVLQNAAVAALEPDSPV